MRVCITRDATVRVLEKMKNVKLNFGMSFIDMAICEEIEKR